jgi:sec-independent protein translocase protein TatA
MRVMIANIFGGDGLIVLVVAVVVLFGGNQLPKLAKNVGSAGREFRKAQQEAEEEHARSQAEAIAPAVAKAPEVVAPAPVVAPPVTRAPDDQLVISRSELKQELSNLLDEREKHSDR